MYATHADVPDEEIVQRYFDRWGAEECIQEAKQQMGFETSRGRCSKTVNRQTPLAMVLVTLVKAWYARCAAEEPSLLPNSTPWNPTKTRPSFLDMLAALRGGLWRHRITPNSKFKARVRDILETVSNALSAAAQMAKLPLADSPNGLPLADERVETADVENVYHLGAPSHKIKIRR